jgi:large subunit ribosomal protein L32e
MRTNEKGWPKVANIGWRGPSAVRGLHPNGKVEILIQNINELKSIDKENHVARIGATVGRRKRTQILEEAEKLGVKILNSRAKAKPSDFEELEEEEK